MGRYRKHRSAPFLREPIDLPKNRDPLALAGKTIEDRSTLRRVTGDGTPFARAPLAGELLPASFAAARDQLIPTGWGMDRRIRERDDADGRRANTHETKTEKSE